MPMGIIQQTRELNGAGERRENFRSEVLEEARGDET